MKNNNLLNLIALLITNTIYSQVNPNEHFVRSYETKSGVIVDEHFRTNPNSTNTDNFGTRPNINPHTFKIGTIEPDYNSELELINNSTSSDLINHIKYDFTYLNLPINKIIIPEIDKYRDEYNYQTTEIVESVDMTEMNIDVNIENQYEISAAENNIEYNNEIGNYANNLSAEQQHSYEVNRRYNEIQEELHKDDNKISIFPSIAGILTVVFFLMLFIIKR